MNETDDIIIDIIDHFKRQAAKKGLTLKEYAEKIEQDIKKVMGEDNENL